MIGFSAKNCLPLDLNNHGDTTHHEITHDAETTHFICCHSDLSLEFVHAVNEMIIIVF